MNFSDQFAFRPTGSTTAAIINLLHIIANMLLSNPYVIVISLDFSKAFDMVRHSALLDKLNHLDIPDTVYNWMVDVLSDRSHCTIYGGQTSSQKSITAGIIQGSGIEPVAYMVTAGDLKLITVDNKLIKFADDTYLIIPASNCLTRSAEVDNIEHWAQINNLNLTETSLKKSSSWTTGENGMHCFLFQFQALFESQLSKFWA